MANTNQGESLGSTTSHFATEAQRKAQAAASAATERARDAAANVGHKVQDMASSASQKAQDVAANVGHKAEEARSSVGEQMKSLAGTIRDKAPQEGMTGRAASAVASGLETSGSYLQEHDFSNMAGDMTNLIRRYPLQAVLVGIGVGFLLAKATRS